MGGFIYLWYDLKRKMFYLGSHWGCPNDGYVCSSTRMKRAFKRRPDTFKRRIVAHLDSRTALLLEEERFLQMIPDEQLGVKYYNLHRRTGHWHGRSDRSIVVEKLKASWTDERKLKAKKTQSESWTPERKARFRQMTTGRKRSELSKEKMRAAARSRPAVTQERRDASAERLRLVAKKRFEGYWESRQTRKEKLAEARQQTGYVPPDRSAIASAQWSRKTLAQKEETSSRMSEASRGKTYVISPEGNVKRVPLTELRDWISLGWLRGRTLTPSTESLRKRKF